MQSYFEFDIECSMPTNFFFLIFELLRYRAVMDKANLSMSTFKKKYYRPLQFKNEQYLVSLNLTIILFSVLSSYFISLQFFLYYGSHFVFPLQQFLGIKWNRDMLDLFVYHSETDIFRNTLFQTPPKSKNIIDPPSRDSVARYMYGNLDIIDTVNNDKIFDLVDTSMEWKNPPKRQQILIAPGYEHEYPKFLLDSIIKVNKL